MKLGTGISRLLTLGVVLGCGSTGWAQCPKCGTSDQPCRVIIRKVVVRKQCIFPAEPPRAIVTGVMPFVPTNTFAVPFNVQVSAAPLAPAAAPAPAPAAAPAAAPPNCAGSGLAEAISSLRSEIQALRNEVADIRNRPTAPVVVPDPASAPAPGTAQ
jgi:hypothetical protein